MPAFPSASAISRQVTAPNSFPSSPPRVGGQGEGSGGQRRRHRLGGLPRLLRPRLDRPPVVIEGFHVPHVRQDRQLPRDQVVPPEPVRDLDDLSGLPQLLHVLAQDDFHRGASYRTCVAVKEISARIRAFLISTVSFRWCFAQFPVMRRGTIFPRSETNCLIMYAFL